MRYPKILNEELNHAKHLMGLREETAKEKQAEESNLPLTAAAKTEVLKLIKGKRGKKVNDSEIHAIADKYKISPHKLESFIYTTLSKKMTMKEDKELDMGKEVEKEHDPTYDKIKKYYESYGDFPNKELVFMWIAKDHLQEFKDYYTRLAQMEKEAKAANNSGQDTAPTNNKREIPKPKEFDIKNPE